MEIQKEGIESSKQNVALEIKWNQCREDMEEPQELYKVFKFSRRYLIYYRQFKNKKRSFMKSSKQKMILLTN